MSSSVEQCKNDVKILLLFGLGMICLFTLFAVGACITAYNNHSYSKSAMVIEDSVIRCEIVEFSVVRSGKYNHNVMALVRCADNGDGINVSVKSIPVGKTFLWVRKTRFQYRDKVIETRFDFLRYD